MAGPPASAFEHHTRGGISAAPSPEDFPRLLYYGARETCLRVSSQSPLHQLRSRSGHPPTPDPRHHCPEAERLPCLVRSHRWSLDFPDRKRLVLDVQCTGCARDRSDSRRMGAERLWAFVPRWFDIVAPQTGVHYWQVGSRSSSRHHLVGCLRQLCHIGGHFIPRSPSRDRNLRVPSRFSSTCSLFGRAQGKGRSALCGTSPFVPTDFPGLFFGPLSLFGCSLCSIGCTRLPKQLVDLSLGRWLCCHWVHFGGRRIPRGI